MYKLLTLILCVSFVQIQAQEFADKEFYLLDSLVLEDLSEYDRSLIDSMLNLYHDTEEDTIKLSYIESLVENCWDDLVWPKYNEVLLRNAIFLGEQENVSKIEYQAFKYYSGSAYGNKAYLNAINGNNSIAIDYYNLAMEDYVTAKNEQGQGVILNFLSTMYQRNGDVVKAVETIERSIKLVEKSEYTSNTVACYYNMVTIQSNMGNYQEADYYNGIMLEIAKKIADERMVGLSILLRASSLLKQGRFHFAKKKVLTANNILEDQSNNRDILKVYEVWTEVEIALENWTEALRVNNKLDKLSIEAGVVFDMIRVKSNKLEIYFNTGNYSLAKKNGEEALILLNEVEHFSSNLFVLDYLAQIAQNEGDYKKANAYLLEWGKIKEVVFSKEIKNQGAKQVIEYKYDKQKELDDIAHEQDLALAEAQKQKIRIGMFAAVLIALIIAIAAYLIYSRLKVIQEQKVKLDDAYEQLEESKKNELAVSNLKALQSQMNPHFIFNALNSVQDLVLLKDIRSSNKFLGKFSDLIRKILLSSKQQFISLEEEVVILSLYLDLEGLRFGDEFHIDFICEVPKEKQEEIQLPAMFIQPYIENAIKHGLFNKKGAKHLKVAFIMINETTLECIVEDNGVGQKQAALMKEQRLHLHTGFSTEAINERIRLLNQTLDKKIELETVDLEENGKALGTKIILHFPV